MTKTLILTTTIFALLWIMTLSAVLIPLDFVEQQNSQIVALLIFVGEIARFNHIINPVLYGFMCTRFQVEFKRLFRITF